MSSQLALPRLGHLEQVFHIFGYLKSHHNAELVFDPTYPEIDKSIKATFRDKIGQPANLVTLKERKPYLQMRLLAEELVSFSGPKSMLTTPLILSLEDRDPVLWST